jgi:dTDP-glucose 4,6-dehydratase
MRILVTGGLGTIGSVLVKELETRGHDVTIADLPHHHAKNYVRCDIGEWADVDRLWDEHHIELIYNCAAEFGRHNGEDYYQRLHRSNITGVKNILRASKLYDAKVVYFSSSEVYGDYSGIMSEDVMEKHAIRQLNDYAVTKWMNELQIMNSAEQDGTQSVRVRLFNTYGVGEYYSPYRSALCQFIYKALHGEPITVYRGHRRTSTYVTDTVRTLANIADNFIAGEVYNIGGVSYHTMEAAAQMVTHAVGEPVGVHLKDPEPFTTKDKQVDVSKAMRDLDHCCEVSLYDGIARTVAWMREVYDVKEPV